MPIQQEHVLNCIVMVQEGSIMKLLEDSFVKVALTLLKFLLAWVQEHGDVSLAMGVCRKECGDESVGMGAWGWEYGDGSMRTVAWGCECGDANVGLGTWGWQRGNVSMGMGAWGQEHGDGWEHG